MDGGFTYRHLRPSHWVPRSEVSAHFCLQRPSADVDSEDCLSLSLSLSLSTTHKCADCDVTWPRFHPRTRTRTRTRFLQDSYIRQHFRFRAPCFLFFSFLSFSFPSPPLQPSRETTQKKGKKEEISISWGPRGGGGELGTRRSETFALPLPTAGKAVTKRRRRRRRR